jgi:hypothetical protein
MRYHKGSRKDKHSCQGILGHHETSEKELTDWLSAAYAARPRCQNLIAFDELGCEGIICKRLGSPYRSGRSPHWMKIKNPAAPAVTREAEEDWS